MSTKNQQWLLKERPVGHMTEENFEWAEIDIPALGDGEVLVRNLLLSLDPTNRIWAAQDSYLDAVKLGSPMSGIAIGVVEESNNPKFEAGDIVQGMIGWQSHLVSDGRGLLKLPPLPPSIPLDAHFGLFGHIGLTAYFGLIDICEPKEGETLVVDAAAGAVGSLVCQIGKIKGCRVVGIAGTDEKCDWLVNDLGIDAAINYKTENVGKKLREHAPNGVDMIFENVGGEIFQTVLSQINTFARIALCGFISEYNATEPVPGPNLGRVLVQRAKMQGFIVLDYQPRAMEAVMPLAQWLQEGKIKYRTHIVEGLENTPNALNMLFDGSNQGKLLVQVSDL